MITEARFGLKDENGHLYPNPLMEELFGVVHEYTEPTPRGFFDGLQGQKRPRIITKKIGKGKAIYANFSLFLEIQNGNSKWRNFLRRNSK